MIDKRERPLVTGEDARRFAEEYIKQSGPSLLTLHRVYTTFGITAIEFEKLPAEHAKLYARFANALYQ